MYNFGYPVILVAIALQASLGAAETESSETESAPKLEVIGSGFGRTGTGSLRAALTILGYKSYHMNQLTENGSPEDLKIWSASLDGGCSNVEGLTDMFGNLNYTAAVGFPVALCWEELYKSHPEALVIHTERASPEEWWASASATILTLRRQFPFWLIYSLVPFFQKLEFMENAMYASLTGRAMLPGNQTDFPGAFEGPLLDSYTRNNAQVRKVVGKRQLLVLDLEKGWAPLCMFLGKPIPDVPFPHLNSRADFGDMLRQAAVSFVLAGACLVGICALVPLMFFGESEAAKKRRLKRARMRANNEGMASTGANLFGNPGTTWGQ